MEMEFGEILGKSWTHEKKKIEPKKRVGVGEKNTNSKK